MTDKKRMTAKRKPRAVVAELLRYAHAIDAIYNEGECARKAVLKHFGLIHSPIANALRNESPLPAGKRRSRRG